MNLYAWYTKTAGIFYSPSPTQQAGELVFWIFLIGFVGITLFNILCDLAD